MEKKDRLYNKVLIGTLFVLFILFLAPNWILGNKYGIIYPIIMLVCLVAVCVLFVIDFKDKDRIYFAWLDSRKCEIIAFVLVMLVATLLRVADLTNNPAGINLDEWSMIYDSWSLANYGIDRNGYSWPVYFVAWGSGQNALLTYLTIPFVKLFGICSFSSRIVICLSSIASVAGIYFLVKRLSNKKIAFISMVLFAVIPWEVMLARWGLECNLLPCMLIFGTLYLVKAIQGNPWWFLLSGLFYGLSLYTYAINYVFLPLFLLAVYIILIIKKKVHWPSFIIGNKILLAFALPHILFLMVNMGWIGEFKIFGLFSVPKLTAMRTAISGGFNPIMSLINMFRLLILQDDFWDWNTINPFGFLFPISLPFIICGIIYFCKNIKVMWRENIFELFMFVWLIVGFVVSFVMSSYSVNHINCMLVPLVYTTARGIDYFSKNSRKFLITLASIYSVCVISFACCYFSPAYKQQMYDTYSNGLEDAVLYAESIREDDDTVYVDISNYTSRYILVAAVSKTTPMEFCNTVVYRDNTVGIRKATSFGHFNFVIDNEMQGDIYILLKDNYLEIDQSFQQTEIGDYIVCYR